ncbi:MAG: hypothetical protein PHP54_02590 [Clostridia bacterium]|nr:hypothetical protein [Clostridia bacterium]
MAATMVKFEGIESSTGRLRFSYERHTKFFLRVVEELGITELTIDSEDDLVTIATMLAGCYEKGSNMNGCQMIVLHYYGISVQVTRGNAIAKFILAELTAKWAELIVKGYLPQEKVNTTPMAKFTRYSSDSKTLGFYLGEYPFSIVSFQNGVVTLQYDSRVGLIDFVTMVVSCFNEKSNLYGFDAIESNILHVPIRVTSENVDVDAIVNQLRKDLIVEHH